MSALATEAQAAPPLERTPLHGLHLERGARMVPFAGYEMPVSYQPGILKEHLHTRSQAGLFDVSHMGQAVLIGPDHETAAAALEALTPGALRELRPGQTRYTMLLNEDGGIIDDLMVTRSVSEADDGRLLLVVNAARKQVDLSHIADRLPPTVALQPVEDCALIALQGPRAAAVMDRHCPEAGGLAFLTATGAAVGTVDCHVGRSGYTGEDGFEISLAAAHAEEVARALLDEPEVELIGLGARDSLRLEAGLCLHGHDIDESTTPVEAGLAWVIGKRRRAEGGFPGAARVLRQLETGPDRIRVGLRPEGRAPAREGAGLEAADGTPIGAVTSGLFGPSVGGPIAMGYVRPEFAAPGTAISVRVRGKAQGATVQALPFVAHSYVKSVRP
ncbi:MAG: glycine cleavage system aminomethyltransferase GcvT [Hyphomicrobiales bacterium]|nr:glycine cleavage system aminomethyltransferase GcvT [Hyphomicrobiales bacterium]